MDTEATTVSRYQVFPLIPLRGISVFPGMRLIFDVDREESLGALNAAMEGDQTLFLVAQRDPSAETSAAPTIFSRSARSAASIRCCGCPARRAPR